jgi:hypothetical protein
MDGPSLAPPLAPDKMTHQFPPENRLGPGNTALHSLFIQHTGRGIQHCIYCLFSIQGTAQHTMCPIQNTGQGIRNSILLFIHRTMHSTTYIVLYCIQNTEQGICTEPQSALYSPCKVQHTAYIVLYTDFTEYRAGNAVFAACEA